MSQAAFSMSWTILGVQVRDNFEFEGFGTALGAANQVTNVLFARQYAEHDMAYYMRSRYYIGGRFLTADVFLAGTENVTNAHLYLYVGNSPLSFADPSGMARQPVREFNNIWDKMWDWVHTMESMPNISDLYGDFGGGEISNKNVQSLINAGYRVEEFPAYYKAENTPDGNAAWRLNNPGGIEFSKTSASYRSEFFGSEAVSSKRFIKFPTMTLGLLAMVAVLERDYKDDTVIGGWQRYAPSFENNSHDYMQRLSEHGVDLNKSVGSQIEILKEAVPKVELGNAPPGALVIFKAGMSK